MLSAYSLVRIAYSGYRVAYRKAVKLCEILRILVVLLISFGLPFYYILFVGRLSPHIYPQPQ
jgi:hypothetical protein